MTLELIREAIKASQVAGENSSQTIVENDIIVPDSKPDIDRILLLDGDVSVNTSEAAQDKVIINGSVRYNILYVADDDSHAVKSINTNSAFSYALDIPGSRSGMKCKTKCSIDHIEYNILNGRKINIKAVVGVYGRSVDMVDLDIVNDLKNIEKVQVLRSTASINCYTGSAETAYTVRENLEVPSGKPAIRELLRSDVKITGKDYKVTDNKVIARGALNISTLYIADDEDQSIQIMEHEVPFTQFIDVSGINEDSSCEVDYRILEQQFEAEEDTDGELRALGASVTLNIAAAGYSKKNFSVIEDAYSPYARLALEKKPFKIEDVAVESKSQATLRSTAVIGSDNPEIVQVFNVLSKPSLTEYRIDDGKAVIEGVVENNILYLTNSPDQPVYCFHQELPFKQSIDLEGTEPDMKCDINLDVEHCTYSMVSSNEVDVRLALGIGIKLLKEVSLPLLVKVNELPVEDKRNKVQPSITIYFSQPEDTLWRIAKKYYTTVDDIRSMNNLSESEEITPGQQVFIPKRA